MLRDDLTKEKFGYSYDGLSYGSKKTIILQCDYCGKEYNATKKQRLINNKIIDKDSCLECRYHKRRDVSLARDGVENSAQRKEIREKIAKANSEMLQSEEFKQRAKETNLKKYGVEYAMQSDEVKEKQKAGIRHKYGVDNISELPETREKAKSTMIDRYGENYKDILKEKRTKTNLKNYGVENPFQREDIKEKSKETCNKKYGYDYALQNKNIAREAQEKSIKTKIENGQILIHEGKTIKEMAKETGYSKSRFSVLVKKYGVERALCMTPKESCLEFIYRTWLESEDIDFIKQKRTGKYYADFQVGNCLIELDGIYWHSEKNDHIDDDYHQKKHSLYTSLGYKPLFFRENEINDKFEIVKSISRNAFGLSKYRLYARKCSIKQVEKGAAKQFLTDNHLMGAGSGDSFGLYFNDDLVALIQIRCLNKKYKEYDISRFCCKIDHTIVGGFSRLLTYAESNLDMNSLRTFIDLRYGSGDYLESFGFVRRADYVSFKWTDGFQVFNRMKFPGNSGYHAGFVKIFDCGQLKFEKFYNGV